VARFASTAAAETALMKALYDEHASVLWRYALRLTGDASHAEDVVQEAFSRLARADVSAIDDPEGWLVVVTSRLCLDRLRTRFTPIALRAAADLVLLTPALLLVLP